MTLHIRRAKPQHRWGRPLNLRTTTTGPTRTGKTCCPSASVRDDRILVSIFCAVRNTLMVEKKSVGWSSWGRCGDRSEERVGWLGLARKKKVGIVRPRPGSIAVPWLSSLLTPVLVLTGQTKVVIVPATAKHDSSLRILS
jgi:hypothetical protein